MVSMIRGYKKNINNRLTKIKIILEKFLIFVEIMQKSRQCVKKNVYIHKF